MLGSVEYVDITADGLGRDEVGVLRHVSSTIDFVVVIDALYYPYVCLGVCIVRADL